MNYQGIMKELPVVLYSKRLVVPLAGQ